MIDLFNKLPRWLFWELAVPLTALNLWLLNQAIHYFQGILTILITASLLAFLLNYPIAQVQKRGIPRGQAVTVMVITAILLVGALGFTLMPMLLKQLSDLANRLPNWIQSSQQQLLLLDSWLKSQAMPLDLSGLAAQLESILPQELTILPDQVSEFLLGFADSLLEILITGVFTLYLLLHGDSFWQGLLQWLPGTVGAQVQSALKQQFQNYFLGQVTLASLMGITLTLLFFLLKIPYWLVFGLGIGVTVLIPFGDFLGIAIATVLVSLKSLWLGGEVLVISLITDQVIDNAVAPRLLGSLVGLNPIWVLIMLLVGAQVGGLLGVLIAVPLAGSAKSVIDNLKISTDITTQ